MLVFFYLVMKPPSAVKSSGRPDKLLRGFAHLLHCLFERDYHHPTPYAPQSSWWGASDASASDSGEAYVGGWISNQPHPENCQNAWRKGFVSGQQLVAHCSLPKALSSSCFVKVWLSTILSSTAMTNSCLVGAIRTSCR